MKKVVTYCLTFGFLIAALTPRSVPLTALFKAESSYLPNSSQLHFSPAGTFQDPGPASGAQDSFVSRAVPLTSLFGESTESPTWRIPTMDEQKTREARQVSVSSLFDAHL